MKEELIELSKSKEFFSAKFCYADLDELTYYLWMCEIQKWLREEYDLHIYITPYGDNKGWYITNIRNILHDLLNYDFRDKFNNVIFKSYEEALETGLLEALKLIYIHSKQINT